MDDIYGLIVVADGYPPVLDLRHFSELQPELEKMMGARAGSRENRESCTFRTQRSPGEFLRTISKYTPARPEVKHAATTAMKPLKAFMSAALSDDL